MASFSKTSHLYFSIIWFQYSFYLTFYSIFKSFFWFGFVLCFFGHPPASWPDTCSSFQLLLLLSHLMSPRGTRLSSHGTISLLTVPALSSAGTCFPRSSCGRFLLVIQILARGPLLLKSWPWPPSCSYSPWSSFILLFITGSFLACFCQCVVYVFTLKWNHPKKGGLVSYVPRI